MVTAEELRDRIDKFNQKAEELLLQEKHDSARPYLEHVKNLQKRLDDLTGGDVLRLDVRSADAVVHLVCLQWSVSAKVIYSCWAVVLWIQGRLCHSCLWQHPGHTFCGPCVAGGLQNEQRQMLLTKEAVREALKEDKESNKTVCISDVGSEVWNIIQGNASKTTVYADLLLTLLSNQSHA